MTYEEAINFLYNSLPVFQREGASAYKPGLQTSIALDDIFGNPHKKFKTIHIAGTNGKGSTSHTLAAILTRAGYKTGLYTSPHIFDFRERIRVDGKKIPKEAVVDFVSRWQCINSGLRPSFFELTSTMAFEYFASEKIDVAVIEVGLGGRLDSTNIITPELSIITNISLDHTSLLGNSIEEIAFEKAGIIKTGVPVLIGERNPLSSPIFEDIASKSLSPISFAKPLDATECKDGLKFRDTPFGELIFGLTGEYQRKNAATICESVTILKDKGFRISDTAVREGFANVVKDTGLFGRWTRIGTSPEIVADTAHNIGGWEEIVSQLDKMEENRDLHLIVGFVNDKDISSILNKISDLRRRKRLYFATPSVPRGLKAQILSEKAAFYNLEGDVIDDVNEALNVARKYASPNDLILIAGSNFLIADLKISAPGEN